MGDLMIVFNNFKAVLKNNVKFTKQIIEEKEMLNNYAKTLENDLKITISEFKNNFNNSEF